MSDLRDIVRRHVEHEVLKELLGENFDQTDGKEKERLLNILRTKGEIDREIDGILNQFVNDAEKLSAKKENPKKWLKIIQSAIVLVLTTIIGVAVKQSNWAIATIAIIGQVLAIIFFTFHEPSK